MKRIGILSLLLLPTLGGCLARTLTIETSPPGATVYMDHALIGRTPLSRPFTYGGIHEFLIFHEEGKTKYEPLRVFHDTSDFFYDTFPFDLLVAISPATAQDNKTLHFKLTPSTTTSSFNADPKAYISGLSQRARDLRERVRTLQENAPPAPLLRPVKPNKKAPKAPGVKRP